MGCNISDIGQHYVGETTGLGVLRYKFKVHLCHLIP